MLLDQRLGDRLAAALRRRELLPDVRRRLEDVGVLLDQLLGDRGAAAVVSGARQLQAHRWSKMTHFVG